MVEQPIRTHYARINNVCLVILAAFAAIGALIYTRIVLVPLMVAVFIYAMILPIIKWFQDRLKMARVWAMTMTGLTFAALIFLLGWLITASVGSFLENADFYSTRLAEFARWLGETNRSVGMVISEARVQEELRNLPVMDWATRLTGGIFSFIGNVVLVMIFVMFMAAGHHPPTDHNSLAAEIQKKISSYLATKFMLAVTCGGLVYITLLACQATLSFLFAVVAILLCFVPTVGPIVATLLPLPLIALEHGFGWQFTVAAIVISVVQFVVGNVIEPKLLGESMDLHPVTVMVFLVFWGLVWGLPGMFMAVPITAILKIVMSRIETTRPMAELLAGRF